MNKCKTCGEKLGISGVKHTGDKLSMIVSCKCGAKAGSISLSQQVDKSLKETLYVRKSTRNKISNAVEIAKKKSDKKKKEGESEINRLIEEHNKLAQGHNELVKTVNGPIVKAIRENAKSISALAKATNAIIDFFGLKKTVNK